MSDERGSAWPQVTGPRLAALLLATVAPAVIAASAEALAMARQDGPGGDRDPAAPWSFSAVQVEAGLTFVHTHGGSGRYYIVESIGAGVATLDYDVDGWWDVYAVQGAPLPGTGDSGPVPRNALFRNDGSGGFRAVAGVPAFAAITATGAAATAADAGYGMGATAGDFDRDGLVDLYVTNWGPNALYRNNGDGTFSDVTGRAGVADGRWGASATWADFTGDGWIDLFVVNYLDARLDNHQTCEYGPQRFESYCGPALFAGVADVLYRNAGDGTFVDVSETAGVTNAEEGKGLAVHALDDDNDGDQDLFVANDTRRNFLYRNDGSGRFDDVGLLAGVGYSLSGRAQAGMGIEWADLDGDGRPDLLVTHFQDDYNTYYRNAGDHYLDETGDAGLRAPTLGFLAFGVVAFDPDLDGDLDVFYANGHIYDVVERYDPRQPHAQANQLFRNEGGGRFTDVSAGSGPALRTRRVSRGAAAADLDNDGDEDLLVTNNAAELELLANGDYGVDGVAGGLTVPSSVTVRLVGRGSPRAGTGARVVCEADGRRRVRWARTASSFLSQGDARLRCGLGDAAAADLTVEWPSGVVDRVADVAAGSLVIVTEGRGLTASGRLGR